MNYESGEFGRGGQEVCAIELTYLGLLGEKFLNFAIGRAQRLSLDGWISADSQCVKVTVQGPQALVDAFEIVCSLGPIDSHVTSWERNEIPAVLDRVGFSLRGEEQSATVSRPIPRTAAFRPT